ncbi:ArdC family protein [Promicromonospora aerolata]|uniref:ArdC family protein n=1 Tax=Promicromonospora aerolata TaxID=195749 RepID=A0ABW4VEY9_9MICO
MATTREQTKAAREAKLDELHERLTGAVEQLVSGEDWTRALAFAAHFRTRSFSNTLLIWEQHQGAYEAGLVPEPFSSYVAGYQQWQGLGRQVQKGQPGYQILAPVTDRFATATPADAESWRRLGKGEKPRPGEVVRTRMVGVRSAYVWDASQTTGDPMPEPPAPRLLEGDAPASGYTIPYVSTWAARVDGKEPVEVVKATGERVRKTALAVLDRLDTTQVADGTPPGLDRDVAHRGAPGLTRPTPQQAAPLPDAGARPVPVVEGRGL